MSSTENRFRQLNHILLQRNDYLHQFIHELGEVLHKLHMSSEALDQSHEDLRQSNDNIRQSNQNMGQAIHNLAQSDPDLHQSGHNLYQSKDNLSTMSLTKVYEEDITYCKVTELVRGMVISNHSIRIGLDDEAEVILMLENGHTHIVSGGHDTEYIQGRLTNIVIGGVPHLNGLWSIGSVYHLHPWVDDIDLTSEEVTSESGVEESNLKLTYKDNSSFYNGRIEVYLHRVKKDDFAGCNDNPPPPETAIHLSQRSRTEMRSLVMSIPPTFIHILLSALSDWNSVFIAVRER